MKSAYHFFLSQAGYSYDPKTETRMQGRIRAAKELARAEEEAKKRGLVFVWEPDADADLSFLEQPDYADYDGDRYAEGCTVYERCSECGQRRPNSVTGLYSIVDADADYRRVVEAELALEALSELQGGANAPK